jgi:hypothetical protein
MYYGLLSLSSLEVQSVTASFSNNLCDNSRIVSRVGQAANSYGGCLSVHVGAMHISTPGSFIVGPVFVDNMRLDVSSNRIFNCSACSSASGSFSYGANSYGGGVSISVGAYSYKRDGSSPINGSTTVSNSSYIISNNSLTSCTASSTLGRSAYEANSYGSNSYGGGVSISFGAYSYNFHGSSPINGSTTVSSSSYVISNNSLTSCTASSVSNSSSYGANTYGGGVSVYVGAYSYLYEGSSPINGSTTVNSRSYIISNNSLTSCTASSVSGSFLYGANSYGANSYGGGVSISIGTYSYKRDGSSPINGSTTVSSSSYIISNNSLTSCTASSASFSSSYGANTYGGGLSVYVGAYSYSYNNQARGSVISNITVSSSSYIISNNSLTSCTASSVSSSSSYGTNTYGGGVSVYVGAYSYNREGSNVLSGLYIVSFTDVRIRDSFFVDCKSISRADFGEKATSFGGALSVVYETYLYSKVGSSLIFASVCSCAVSVELTSFRYCKSSTLSGLCAPGSSNAAGGASFVSVPNASVVVSSSTFFESSVETGCAAPSSQTFSVGGGLSLFLSADVVVNGSFFENCTAKGITAANNVFVSGGGLFTRAVQVLTLDNTKVVFCGTAQAFSTHVLEYGGGAMGAQNVSAVRISNSQFYNNSDESSTAVVFLQQLDQESHMEVSIANGSILSTSPSISVVLPALRISCGFNCSIEQQSRIRLTIADSLVLAISESTAFRSAVIMSMPNSSTLVAKSAFAKCSFEGTGELAVLTAADRSFVTVSCAPCEKPFEIALSSKSLNLGNFSSFRQRQSCRASVPDSGTRAQRCPFGISHCSTIVNVTAGFWTNYTENGSISSAIYCPANYCGCRNSPGSFDCWLPPIFSPEYESLNSDTLCRHNRFGILCGTCIRNFTQSLNGYSCISNSDCHRNLGWAWAVTVLGYLMYSIYIVRNSLKPNRDGIITCVLFYGQMSSFASIPLSTNRDQPQNSAAWTWISQITQFESVLSLYENSCYGPDMGAYEATLAQLSGPAIVVVTSLLLVAASKTHQMFDLNFRQRNHDIRVSFGVVMLNVLLLVYSSVTSVVFQLITCVDIKTSVDHVSKVVFIDGTQECQGARYHGLIASAALLSIVPLFFWIVLKFNKISLRTRTALCAAYADSKHHWMPITLMFRFVITVTSATVTQVPSIAAMALSVFTVCMLMLLIVLRPYFHQRTFFMEVFCYACLIIQFSLQSVARASESVGVVVAEGDYFYTYISDAAYTSIVLRSVHSY